MPACFFQPANAFEHIKTHGVVQPPDPVRQQPQLLTQQSQFFTDFALLGQHAFKQANDESKIGLGHSSDTYDADDDFAKSLDVAYEHIRRRMANGGPGWVPKLSDDQSLTMFHMKHE